MFKFRNSKVDLKDNFLNNCKISTARKFLISNVLKWYKIFPDALIIWNSYSCQPRDKLLVILENEILKSILFYQMGYVALTCYRHFEKKRMKKKIKKNESCQFSQSNSRKFWKMDNTVQKSRFFSQTNFLGKTP